MKKYMETAEACGKIPTSLTCDEAQGKNIVSFLIAQQYTAATRTTWNTQHNNTQEQQQGEPPIQQPDIINEKQNSNQTNQNTS